MAKSRSRKGKPNPPPRPQGSAPAAPGALDTPASLAPADTPPADVSAAPAESAAPSISGPNPPVTDASAPETEATAGTPMDSVADADASATPASAAATPPSASPAVPPADPDRTVILSDPDPTLTQSAAPASAGVKPDGPAPVSAAGRPGGMDSAPAKGSAAAASAAAVAKGGKKAEAKPAPVAERKTELKGSLRSKAELRARDKARRKGAKEPKEPRPPVDFGALAWEWFKSIAAAVMLFFVIRTFVITAYSIPSESMEDTLLVGDYLMANNALFGATLPFTDVKLPALRDPNRGEIVVFRPAYNEPQIDVVKRVIGVPGDTLQMVDAVLYRNGQRLNEAYAHYDQGYDEPIGMEGFGLMDPTIRPEAYGAKNHLDLLLPSVNKRQYRPSRNNWGPLVVPAAHYWLMGDNRDQSLDSRYMGPIPRRVIRGKPLFIYYSYDKKDIGAPFPRFVTAARWSRLGHGIH